MTYSPRVPLEMLVADGVEFVVIGGVAAGLQGSPMVTFDLDICYERSEDNLQRLATVLHRLHAKLRGVEDEVPFILDAETLAKDDRFTFVTDAGPLDILGIPRGTSGFDDLRAGAVQMDVGGMELLVASVQDLIRMKRAAGRPKDLQAIEELEALRDEIEGLPEL